MPTWTILKHTAAELALITLAQGQLCWTTDTHLLYCGTGAANVCVGGATTALNLDDILDVVITGVTDNEPIAWDAATSKFINQTQAELGFSNTPWISDIDADGYDLTDLGRLNHRAATELTIAAGVATMTQGVHSIDTQADAAEDDLDTISGGTAGDVLRLYPASSSRVVWITDAGNIDTPGSCHYPIPINTAATLYYDGSNWRLLSCGRWGLVGNHTETFTSGMSAATINDMITSMPRELNGYTLTFQFGDGTYTLTAPLLFHHFRGGIVTITGNTGESTALHTNQAAILDFSTGNCNGIDIARCAATMNVNLLAIDIASAGGSAANIGIKINSTLNGLVTGCYVLGTGVTKGDSIHISYTGASAVNTTYLSNTQDGISSSYSKTYSNGNDDTGTKIAYGLHASACASIGKNSTQPTGATADELADTGGVIR